MGSVSIKRISGPVDHLLTDHDDFVTYIGQALLTDSDVEFGSVTTGGLTISLLTDGLVKSTGGVIGEAAAGVDYEPPIGQGVLGTYYRYDKIWALLDQAAVIGLRTSDSPTFAGLTVASRVTATGLTLKTGGNREIKLEDGTAPYNLTIYPGVNTAPFTGTGNLYLHGGYGFPPEFGGRVYLGRHASGNHGYVYIQDLTGILKATAGLVGTATADIDYASVQQSKLFSLMMG